MERICIRYSEESSREPCQGSQQGLRGCQRPRNFRRSPHQWWAAESVNRWPARDRGFEFPARRITISLAPAELPKEGGGLDLPIALGILAASGQVPEDRLNGTEFLGELSLGGKLRAVRGLLPAAIRALEKKRVLVMPA